MHLKLKDAVLISVAATLMLQFVSGCSASHRATPAYDFQKPVFRVTPQTGECQLTAPPKEGEEKGETIKANCIIMLTQDFADVLYELQSACEAAGIAPETCHLVDRKDK